MNNSKWMSSFISQYFFVASTLLAIITILAILVVIFYPRTYTAILLKDDKGRLNINQSSIEGFVKEIILNDGYMKNPKIFVKVYKNKIRIQVKGEIIPRVQVVEKTEVLNQEVKDGLREFFGLNHKVNLQVDVTALSERDRQKSLRVI